jgi:NitT/TauT family transport system substrate-binding protein
MGHWREGASELEEPEASGMPVSSRGARHGSVWRSFVCGMAMLCELTSVARAQGELPVVRLQLQWFHQAQFVGYYVAHALGLYEREGIAVAFIQGGPPVPGAPAIDTLSMLSLGAADVSVAWLASALSFRGGGGDVVNIAQAFKRPAMLLVCRRVAGINRPTDLRGRTIGVWNVGDQHDVQYWLRLRNLGPEAVKLIVQQPDGLDLIEGRVDCATAMAYNEYWTLLHNGLSPADLFVVRFADEGSAFLEDGLYATSAAIADPSRRDRLARFLRASAAGWRYAQENPEEALAVTLTWAPLADRAHQRRMLESVLAIADPADHFGLLDLTAFERSVRIVGLGIGQPMAVAAAASGGWTHRVWLDAGLDQDGGRALTPAVRHYLRQVVNSSWFYGSASWGRFSLRCQASCRRCSGVMTCGAPSSWPYFPRSAAARCAIFSLVATDSRRSSSPTRVTFRSCSRWF